MRAPMAGPMKQPTIAPTDIANMVLPLTSGRVLPAILSAHNGSHCTEPHVPISAMEAKAIASKVVFQRLGPSTSASGCVVRVFTDSFQRCDSGTNKLMPNANRAGAAPPSITQRQESDWGG